MTVDATERRFGSQVRERREALGWSQRRLAEHLTRFYQIELHQTAIARLELGERAIRLGEAAALADLFGLDLNEHRSMARM